MGLVGLYTYCYILNMPARNTLAQLLARPCTPTMRVRMHSVTDRRTDRRR